MKMKKYQVRVGLFFGIFMGVFFMLKDLLFVEDCKTKSLFTIIFAGIFTAFFFGYVMGKLAIKHTKSIKDLELYESEKMLFSSLANYYKGIVSVGGKLFLTSKRLVFKSHKYNFESTPKSIFNRKGRKGYAKGARVSILNTALCEILCVPCG